MLTSLEINNFRTFAHLRIATLGQVNLIVGKNNVGKTTLLEALQVYGSPWPAATAAEMLHYRAEFTGSKRPGVALDVESIFHGRQAKPGTSCSIGPPENGDRLPILNVHARIEEDVDFDKVPPGDLDTPFPWGSQLALTFRFEPPGPSSSTLFPSRRVQFGSERFEANAVVPVNQKPLLLRMTSASAMLSETAERWDAMLVQQPAGEERVIRFLQSLAPIRDIRYIGLADSRRAAFVQLQDQSARIPLISLGEGLGHMFQLAVALQYAAAVVEAIVEADRRYEALKNVFPLVLIDEFQTGIHYTLQAEVWKFVFRTAQELGVQVFATTHSWDCVKGFAEAAQDVPECDALAIRLERSDDRSRAVSFTPDELKIVAREEIEVR